jgi:topoisomerase IA-like protein
VIRRLEAPDGGSVVQVLEGRYGPYVTDGTTNASIPRGTDPVTISLEDSRALIEARAGAPPRPEPRDQESRAARSWHARPQGCGCRGRHGAGGGQAQGASSQARGS